MMLLSLLMVACMTAAHRTSDGFEDPGTMGELGQSLLMEAKPQVTAMADYQRDTYFTPTVQQGRYSINIKGVPMEQWWGTEHIPVIMHGAAAARRDGKPCTYIEAGAHRGAVSLFAAQFGCEVYAFDIDEGYMDNLRESMKLNGMSEEQIHPKAMTLSDRKGGRIDEIVPTDKRITVLKMDIDSMDVYAMRGAEGLFKSGNVDFVNLEFSPGKHKIFQSKFCADCEKVVDDVEYLQEMDKRGYDAYLLDCYPNKLTEDWKAPNGARCLSMNRNSYTEKVQFEETQASEKFLSCLMKDGCEDPILAQQRIMPDHFAAFVEALGDEGEVDLVLKRRPTL